ncbi:MAG: GyrI-like domain-containing protein [Spirochaetes bacterium]|nr:GyrI-like domain-containing protein [Spirochaetota bacterium]MBU1080801.1 GyrI-like domain-containing protein [Spirochaetota bacterium]
MGIYILLVTAALAAVATLAAARYGAFLRVTPTLSEEGGERLVYEELRGDYRLSGPAMDRVYYSLLNERAIETFLGFGLYYDDPRRTPKAELRSEAGCVIEDPDRTRASELGPGFLQRDFPRGTYATAEFPFRGKASIMLGILKVYPALAAAATAAGYGPGGFIMERYDVPGKRILYRKQLLGETRP